MYSNRDKKSYFFGYVEMCKSSTKANLTTIETYKLNKTNQIVKH